MGSNTTHGVRATDERQGRCRASRLIPACGGPASARPCTSPAAQRGITGIETAIIMIAFIVVASMFAATTLSAGLFAADAGRESVQAGLAKAGGSLHVRGSVRAIRGDVDVDGDDVIDLGANDVQAVVKIVFGVSNTIRGTAVELTPPRTSDDAGTDPDASGLDTRTAISFQTDEVFVSEAAWTVAFPGSDDGDYFLEAGEKAEITVWLQAYDNVNALWDLGAGSGDPFLDSAGTLAGISQEFTLQLRPPDGATLVLQRTVPGVLRAQMDLR